MYKIVKLLFIVAAAGTIAGYAGIYPDVSSEVKQIATGFKFTEGPAVAPNGDIYFTDIPNNKIHVWSAKGHLSTYRENTGGANGLLFDSNGNLLICEGGNRRLTLINLKGKVTILADNFKGKKLNSPNDLWIDPKGGVYFTDPRYGKKDNLEQSGEYVYYLPPEGGPLKRVINDMIRPNGIVGTPDGKTLYIADHGDKKIWSYNVNDNGTLSNKKLFTTEASDGMILDSSGNLYLTTDAVLVYNPKGKLLRRIEVPEIPSNVCFGKDGRTLFITARTSLYAIQPKIFQEEEVSDIVFLDKAPTDDERKKYPIICWSETKKKPVPLKIYFLQLNLKNKDYELVTITSTDPDGKGPLEGTLEKPEDLMLRNNVLIAVNASAFQNPTNKNDHIWFEGKHVDIRGLIVSNKKIVSPAGKFRSAFWIDEAGIPNIGSPENIEKISSCVAGWNSGDYKKSGRLLKKGKICIKQNNSRHPRTAIGFDKNKKIVTMVVVDGRQKGYSEGVSLYELAEIMKSCGCFEAINLDGGGSSIMIANENSSIKTINKPSGKSHRPIPVMIGIRKVKKIKTRNMQILISKQLPGNLPNPKLPDNFTGLWIIKNPKTKQKLQDTYDAFTLLFQVCSIRFYNFFIPISRIFYRSFESIKINMDKAESVFIPFCPFKIIHKRPNEIPANIRSVIN